MFYILLASICFFLNDSTSTKNPFTPKLIFSEDFDKINEIPSNWWHEGSTKVYIENGRLRVDANPDEAGETQKTSTVWLNKEFTGNLRIEFDAHIVASKDTSNNINFFLLYSDTNGESLQKSQKERPNASYPKYHAMNGYIFTYVANGTTHPARFRLRDNPGFHLLAENYTYENQHGKTYHITIEKIDSKITYSVDGNMCLEAVDDQFAEEHQKGIIGFRTYHTDLWWDNLKIFQYAE